MEEVIVTVLAPVLLWALAVGGLVYPIFLWGKTRLFLAHVAALVAGLVVGLLADWSLSGLRTGLAIGGSAVPLYRKYIVKSPAIRTESTDATQSPPQPERTEREENPQ